ncbi:MAG: YHYH protein [Bacteroidota bacterium]
MKTHLLICLTCIVSLALISCGEDDTVSDMIEDISYTATLSGTGTSLPENGGSASITISLSEANQGDAIDFQLSFAGTATLDQDYSLSSQNFSIPAGSQSATFAIDIQDDTVVEGDEDIVISLSFPNAADVTLSGSASVNFTITDDDVESSACSGTQDSYQIDLDASGCKESAEDNLGVMSEYTVSTSGNMRIITSNSIPNHNIGMFPNSGNPNTISVQNKTFEIALNPSKSSSTTSLTTSNGQPRYWFGILDNSVVLAPIAAEFFTNTSNGQDNTDWNENALSSNIRLGTDCNNSHVFPSGRYHHHATPSAYIADRGITSGSTTQIGWAADGFPIYYKYGNKGGSIEELASSYRLKTTERGGDGVSAPSGCPDGTYTQDYEYVAGLGDLDECNGYEDPTLGYIYVITDTYPSIPRCFSGTPSDDFQNR